MKLQRNIEIEYICEVCEWRKKKGLWEGVFYGNELQIAVNIYLFIFKKKFPISAFPLFRNFSLLSRHFKKSW